MLSPLVSWILSSSSSSSSSDEEEEEESLDINTDELDHENDNVADEENNDQNDNADDDNNDNDHFLSSCDIDDTIPVALAVPDASPAVTVAFPAADDRNTIATTATAATTIVTRPKRQRNTNYSGMGRQYQRLWTKQDEMELLKGYLDFVKQHRRATSSLQNDVALLYDHVSPKLNVGFNRNQLVEKLRRLKRKHKMTLDRGKEVPFKSPQEQAIFEISHKIWGNDRDQNAVDGNESSPIITESHELGNVKVKTEQVDNCDEIENGVLRSPKRPRLNTNDVKKTNEENNGDTATSIQGFIEETLRSCFSPLLKEELLDDAQEGPLHRLALNPVPLCTGDAGDEQWRKRRILELEVYLNRLELLQDQIKARLEELRSS